MEENLVTFGHMSSSGASPPRPVAAERLVAREGRFQDALAAGQHRELPLEIVQLRRWEHRLDPRDPVLHRRPVDGGAEPPQREA